MMREAYDVAIIGGAFAGLTAALQLGRASRRTLVIDAGAPRNAASPAAHGVPGWDGAPPAEILARFRSDLAAYPAVSLRVAEAARIAGEIDRFAVTLSDPGAAPGTHGVQIEARRILLAHGVQDVPPAIPGLAALWGRTVLHCPYCHGYEVKGAPLGVLSCGPMAAHQALMLRAGWSGDVTLFGAPPEGTREALEAAGVTLDPRTPARLSPASAGDPGGIALDFADGAPAALAALFVQPRAELAGSPAAALGCATADGPQGRYLRIGPMGQTDIPGVFAAGDLVRPAASVAFAIGDGAAAGTGCHQSLLFPDFVPPLHV